ncbi:MAG: FkbM family methyltransferase [Candidatus Omnitrophota bacterium]
MSADNVWVVGDGYMKIRSEVKTFMKRMLRRLRCKARDMLEMTRVLRYVYAGNNVVQSQHGKIIVSINDKQLGFFRAILRKRSSDFAVFRQVYIQREQGVLVEKIVRDNEKDDVRYIIDAGAYTGYTCIYFKRMFPQAKIVAVEPESNNYALLLDNIRLNALEDIVALNRGLWVDDAGLEITRELGDGRDWSAAVKASQARVPILRGIAMKEIMYTYQLPYIDILKIDIEGAEWSIFDNHEHLATFLPLVRYLAMEIHEEVHAKEKICKLLKDFHFEYFFYQELIIGYNTKFNKPR